MKKIISLLLIIGLSGVIFLYRDSIFTGGAKNELVIGLNTEATDLSPYGLDLNNATRTANIYQGLVMFDKNLRITPALAISWGNVDDTTWEFRLRQGVSFHDGTLFTAQDVLDAFEKAKVSQNPTILPYLKSIEKIDVLAKDKIQIKTLQPDPLLLSKLTKLSISKTEKIGTGPYQFKEWLPGNKVILKAFPDYWGVKPKYSSVVYKVQESRVDRETGFEKGELDLLAAVTPDQALNLPAQQLKKMYGLEVNFLMFKMDDPIFSQLKYREAVQKLIDPQAIETIGNHFIKPATQFVASGVFGFNQDLKLPPYQIDQEPRDLFGIKLEPLEFDSLETYQTLAEYLSSQLQKAGFSVKNSPLTPEALLDKIRSNQSQLYLIGWQFEDGDAGSFFDSFIHSDGVFNQGRYKNQAVDDLIEQSRAEMDPQQRLKLLKEIGSKVQADRIGIPLFETSRLYALQPEISWEPRLDGLILASEIK